MTNILPELKAFKRAPSLGLSQWENGNLTTNLAEKKDTDGAFFLVEAMLAPGTEPPPHVHTREDELFYVLEGEFDVYVGKEVFKVEALPRLWDRFAQKPRRQDRVTSPHCGPVKRRALLASFPRQS